MRSEGPLQQAATLEQRDRRTVVGGFENLASSVGGFVGKFLLNLALVRLISPDAFGTYAVALGFASLLSLPTNFSFPQALVQMKDRKGLFRGVLSLATATQAITVALVLATLLLGGNLGSGSVQQCILAFTCIQLIAAPAACTEAQVVREGRYRLIAVTKMIGLSVSIPVALIATQFTSGPLALVLRDAVPPVMTLAITGFQLRGRTELFQRADRELFRDVMKMGLNLFANRVIEITIQSVQTFGIAAAFGRRTLGLYDQARYLANLPAVAVQPTLQSVGLRTFKVFDDTPDRRSRGILLVEFLFCRTAVLFAVPGLVASDLVVRIVLGSAWTDASIHVRWLSIVLVVHPLLLARQTLLTSQFAWRDLRLAAFASLVGLMLGGLPAIVFHESSLIGLAYGVSALTGLVIMANRTAKLARFDWLGFLRAFLALGAGWLAATLVSGDVARLVVGLLVTGGVIVALDRSQLVETFRLLLRMAKPPGAPAS